MVPLAGVVLVLRVGSEPNAADSETLYSNVDGLPKYIFAEPLVRLQFRTHEYVQQQVYVGLSENWQHGSNAETNPESLGKAFSNRLPLQFLLIRRWRLALQIPNVLKVVGFNIEVQRVKFAQQRCHGSPDALVRINEFDPRLKGFAHYPHPLAVRG
jgi:hypothetical protein